MSAPDIGPLEIERVHTVMTSGMLSMGEEVRTFERAIAALVGTGHAAALSSGTAGLHACVIAAGIADGDEVITTPFSFVSSANCLLYERAVPRFVDIDPETGNIDPALIEAAITPRTRAILPVHVFGQPADMDPIMEIARRRGLAVIEDACEAIGAEYKSRRVGAIGDAGVFAFYPNKQMTTGEGGAVVTNRADWDGIVRSIRNQGRDPGDSWLAHARLGYNYRLDELSAAIGVAQLQRIEELLTNRARVADAYTARLREIDGVRAPTRAATTTRTSWFVYVIRVRADVDRDRLIVALDGDGVPTRPYFPSVHLQPVYRSRFGHREGDYPKCEAVSRQSLAIPFHGRLSDDDIDYVCDRLRARLADPACRRTARD
jgi:perosamine synthetase